MASINDIALTIHFAEDNDAHAGILTTRSGGFEIFGSKLMLEKTPSLNSSVGLVSYRVEWDGKTDLKRIDAQIDGFMKKNSCRVLRQKQGQEKEIDIRVYVKEMFVNDGGVDLVLRLESHGTARVDEIMEVISSPYGDFSRGFHVERTGLYIEEQGKRLTPLEVE